MQKLVFLLVFLFPWAWASSGRVDAVPPARASCPGCTAFVVGTLGPAGMQVWWGGCPSSTCPPGEACQTANGGGKRWCECTNGCLGDCQAKVTINQSTGEVSGWSCIRKGCTQACTIAPFPPVAEGPFYPCEC